MGTHLKQQIAKSAKTIQPLGQREAAAVLEEMRRQAEVRLLEACQEFQDIAFEMEWRMSDWQHLLETRRNLRVQIEHTSGLRSRFNVNAKQRKGKTPQDKSWARLHRQLQAQLRQLDQRVHECAAAIMTRNEEGRYLEEEVVMLQDKIARLSIHATAQPPRSRVRLVRPGEENEALARLSLELSAIDDTADVGILLQAVDRIEARMHREK